MFSKPRATLGIVGLFIIVAMTLLPNSGKAFDSLDTSSSTTPVPLHESQNVIPDIEVISVTAAPEPVVGQTAILRIAVSTTVESDDASIVVRLPDEIQLVAGELIWHGHLTANQTYVHELSISVVKEGVWRIATGADLSLATTGVIGDSEDVYIESNEDSVMQT